MDGRFPDVDGALLNRTAAGQWDDAARQTNDTGPFSFYLLSFFCLLVLGHYIGIRNIYITTSEVKTLWLDRNACIIIFRASRLRYCTAVAQRRSTKLCTMFGRLLGWYTIYTFSAALAAYRNFARYKIHFASKSCVLLYIGSVTARKSFKIIITYSLLF